MTYNEITKGRFLRRPNRFIADVDINGEEMRVHVKNTGRCRELLVPGAEVILSGSRNPGRKTPYDLVAVYKGSRLINMDSYAPNLVFGEYLRSGALGFVPDYIKPECTHGDSRFDFYFEVGDRKVFAEIKGVTLENAGVVRFPDAPTERGRKHMRGLARCTAEGYEAWAVFVVQMENVLYFEPNASTDPEFSEVLLEAEDAGVRILAYDCKVSENSLNIGKPVDIRLR